MRGGCWAARAGLAADSRGLDLGEGRRVARAIHPRRWERGGGQQRRRRGGRVLGGDQCLRRLAVDGGAAARRRPAAAAGRASAFREVLRRGAGAEPFRRGVGRRKPRKIVAGIWVAFFQECQRESCGQVCDTLRTIALRAADAVLQMHYCAAYDSTLQPPGKGGIPTNNWMRVSRRDHAC